MSKKLSKVLAVALTIAMLSGLVPAALAAEAADPIAVPEGMVAYNLDSETFYSTLESALSEAGRYETVVLVKDYSLKGEEPENPEDPYAPVEVARNVTLLIPTNEYWDDTEEGNNDKNPVDPQGAYVTLEVPEGLSLNVNGTLIVAGNQQGGIGKTGFLNGKYGAIKLDGTMEVNGTLYARGEVTGNGSVTVNDGGTVYQRFEISDWRGGNASLNAYTFYSVYPFNLYEANGLNVTATYHYGATMMGQSYIYSDRRGTGVLTDVAMFGDNGLITPSAGAEVTFKHDPTTEVSTAYVTGTVATGNITIYVDTVLGIEIPITSSHGVGPFGYKQDVVLNAGAVFNVTNPLQVLPGCTITVSSGAKMNIENGMYFFTSTGYDSAWNSIGWPSGIADIGDAKLVVDSSVENPGTVVGTIGSSSDTFVNISGLGSLSSTTSVDVSEVTQSGSSVTRVSATFFTVTLPTTAE